jgi:GNAT superfamily N-acetyltransferase
MDGPRRRRGHRRNGRARLLLRPQALDARGAAAAVDVLHRLIVRRKYSGLGTDEIEWACKRAGELGNNWVRIDVWTDNIGLHRNYQERGFRHVRTLDLSDYPSGALFQRQATDPHETQADLVITEQTRNLPIRPR